VQESPAAAEESAGPLAPAPPNLTTDLVVQSALAHVSRRRQLSAKGPVRGKTISRQKMLEHVRAQIRREIPERVVRAQNELLFGLGAAPVHFDFEVALLALMKAQLAGFYEPRDKTMYLLEDLVGAEREATLAHELVHALQDQHWDLGAKVKFEEDRGDAVAAYHTLAEGDATSAMLDHMLAPRGMKAIDMSDDLIALEVQGSVEIAPGTSDVPMIVKRSVVAPYVDGLKLIHWARRRGGWSAVDAVWARPPTTTEQVLHPEKYLANETGDSLALPPPFPGGPKAVLYRDVLGEQTVRLLFEDWMPQKSAVEAAAGWGGDRAVVFGEGDQVALAWHLRFDDESSAKRAATAFARGILERKGKAYVPLEEAAKALKSGALCRERPDAGPFALVRKGRDLAITAGPFRRQGGSAKSAARCAAAQVWATTIASKR
jgi:hypothetical protein